MTHLVVHFEIHASEPQVLIDFYGELFGWTFSRFGEVPYWIIDTGEEKWIGKVVKAGPVVTEVDDIQRNIVSIMRRVAPGARVAPSGIRIFVLQGAAIGPGVIDDEDGDALDPAASGPYITL